jgi:uncharacterized OsmC-like protein
MDHRTAAAESIISHGDPLGFLFRRAGSQAIDTGRAIIRVEARQMAGHQKEAVVTIGSDGSAWRLTSDEGKHLRGTDLAPFPLGFFNAGLQSDLYGRIRQLALAQGIRLGNLTIRVVNHYWLTGSFIQGTGEGHAEAPDIDVEIESDVPAQRINGLVAAALNASPAIAFLRGALTANRFALYINDRRRQVEGVADAPNADAADPFLTYKQAPRPLDPKGRNDIIEKTGQVEAGTIELASAAVTNKLIRNVAGEGRPVGTDGLYASDTWLAMPGTSHFRLLSDEGGSDAAPSGLGLLSAGIAFCYMTQLSRYIESMKMDIHGVRLVQVNPYVTGTRAAAEPIETHLFLSGEAPPETHLQLLTIAARTCYLHAASKTPAEPNLRIVLNGEPVARAA